MELCSTCGKPRETLSHKGNLKTHDFIPMTIAEREAIVAESSGHFCAIHGRYDDICLKCRERML